MVPVTFYHQLPFGACHLPTTSKGGTPMKAVQVTGYGDIDKLELVEVAIPELKANQVLVKVKACAINNTEFGCEKAPTERIRNRDGVQKAFTSREHPVLTSQDKS